ncbi:hypothetical protein EG349_10275 [Chryseobacterium shandongense]|uniref:DUF935 family protein n=2 Tax=Chryseobacterium TaxID=59732 RepID=A0AAD0YDU1_9FLAO|nr:hypothetical protein EG349_10275 [Chryseobacterium shandongense]AZA95574.1 hypothetical protein EG353_08350 [Chryseobacterium shandongense]
MKPFKQRLKTNPIYRAAEKFFIGNASYTQLNQVMAAGKRQNPSMPSDVVKHQATIMRVEDLASWKTAVMLATDPDNPDKSNLHALYRNQWTDNHLESTIETRIAKTQQSPFKLVSKTSKERDEEAEKLFKTLWFQDFIKLVLEYKFDGTKLIEVFKTNEEGLLTEIKEIEQPYFNAKKGIILKEPGQSTGEDYRNGPLSTYYIQIGKDYKDLGIRALIAPIILAKKLGLGSWLDFIEKYGVPPLFVTTDREDDDRLLELFEMATNFKSNNFMIGRGNEKFEIPNISSTNSQEAFDGLIKRADNEVSKRILGGTGLTDEKGFVGSVEIQFELAQFRFTSDKLLVRNVVNEKLIPLLVKLSPAYSNLANFDFEWDDEDEMTIDKLIKIVSGLGNYFDFDPEQIEQITGLRILGIKNAGSGVTQPEPTAQGASKKKAVT